MEKTSYYLAGEWFAEPYKPVIKQFRGKDRTPLDTVIVDSFTLLRAGWEGDNQVYILDSGEVLCTSHGGSHLYSMTTDELQEHLNAHLSGVYGLRRALRQMQ